MTDFYRVEEENENGCDKCGHGCYWTIVSGEGDSEIGIGTSWGDKELADDVCDLMNQAYESGRESSDPLVNEEEAKLVAFFNSPEGSKLGRDGDYDHLTPAETAIRAMLYASQLAKL